MVIWGNCEFTELPDQRNVQSGNCLVGKISVGELSIGELASWEGFGGEHSGNLKPSGVLRFLFNKQPGSGICPESYLHFQSFWGSKMLHGCLVV